MPNEVAQPAPGTTPIGSLGTATSRAAALEQKMLAGTAPHQVAAPEESDGDEQEVPTRPDRPAPRKVVAPLPLDDDEEEADAAPAAEGGDEDFERITKLEREVVKKSRHHARQERELTSQANQLRAAQQQLEADRRAFNDLQKRLSTPEGLLEHYEMTGGSEEPLRKFIIEGVDPAKKSERAAREAMTPIERKLAEVTAKLEAREQKEALDAAYKSFHGRVSELAESEHAPRIKLVARLQTKDPDYLNERADAVANRLSTPDRFGNVREFTYNHVILELEKELQREARRYVDDEPVHPAAPPANPFDDDEEPIEPQPKPRAKAPAKPSLSNRAASGRTVAVVPEGQVSTGGSLKDRIDAAERRRMAR